MSKLFLKKMTNLLHGDFSLGNVELSPFGDELNDASPGDAGQDDALVQGRCDELLLAVAVIDEGEDIHGANLGDLVIFSEEPKHLLAAKLLGLFL